MYSDIYWNQAWSLSFLNVITLVKHTHLLPGEPNNLDTENCVEMYTDSALWNDNQCGKERAVACRKLAKIAPPLPSGDGKFLLVMYVEQSYSLTKQRITLVFSLKSALSRSKTCFGQHRVFFINAEWLVHVLSLYSIL